MLPVLAGLGYLGYKNKDKIGDAIGGLFDESDSTKQQRADLNAQGQASSDFAGIGEGNFGSLGVEAYDERQRLRDLAMGKNSQSAEQLRQGLQQNLAAQRSMAASASPANSSMAARTAAINAGRMGMGMSGQAAMAGIQERNAAQMALANMLMQQRQQELQAALQGRSNAIAGFGGTKPEPTTLEKYQPLINAGIGAAGLAMSDERLKTDVEDGGNAAKTALERLGTHLYRYKDEKHGKGQQFGIMAQEMERAGLGHAVIDTPEGKAVDGAKAATSALGLAAALAKRVAKLEKGR